MTPYTAATDRTKLTIVDSYGTTISPSSYTVSTNMYGDVELLFMAAMGPTYSMNPTQTLSYAETTTAAYDPAVDGNLNLVIDGTPQVLGAAGDYTISGSQITFTAGNEKTARNTVDTIEYNNSSAGPYEITRTTTTADTLDPITFDNYDGPYYLTTGGGMNPYTAAVADKTKLTIVDSYGTTIPSSNYLSLIHI